jgi:hypothetical protein
MDAGFFITWPGLTTEIVKKHLPKSEATVKGHFRQQFKNIQSTKVVPATSLNPTIDANTKTNQIFVKTIETTGQIYTDQTGGFPVTSSPGYKYIMVLYDYDSNAILAEPMKSRAEAEMI